MLHPLDCTMYALEATPTFATGGQTLKDSEMPACQATWPCWASSGTRLGLEEDSRELALGRDSNGTRNHVTSAKTLHGTQPGSQAHHLVPSLQCSAVSWSSKGSWLAVDTSFRPTGPSWPVQHQLGALLDEPAPWPVTGVESETAYCG